MAHHVIASCSHAYNAFRRTTEPDLICVVRSDYAVPNFIRGSDWEFVEAPVWFNKAAANEGMQYNGFYLFLTVSTPLRMECRTRLAA